MMLIFRRKLRIVFKNIVMILMISGVAFNIEITYFGVIPMKLVL